MKRAIFILFALGMNPAVHAADQGAQTQWIQMELTKDHMRGLTKRQCMEKTISTLKSGCTSDKCLTTVAGITGDCVSEARGSLPEFCESYDREYVTRLCASNELDARRCMVILLGKPSLCGSPAGSLN